MAGTKHENLKFEYLRRGRNFLISMGMAEELLQPELKYVYSNGDEEYQRQPDIALQNFRLIVEVEPTYREANTGKQQLVDYARDIVEMFEFPFIYSILVYEGDNNALVEEVYRYTAEGNLETINISYEEALREVVAEKIPLKPQLFTQHLLPVFSREGNSPFNVLKTLLEKYQQAGTGTQPSLINKLFTAYADALLNVYPTSDLETLRDLFITHTLIQATGIAILKYIYDKVPDTGGDVERYLSSQGLSFSLSLPFLDWYIALYRNDMLTVEEKAKLDEIAREIYYRVYAFQFKDNKTHDTQHIFKHFYEQFVSRAIRQELGEYYTPDELVRFTLQQLKPFADTLDIDIQIDNSDILAKYPQVAEFIGKCQNFFKHYRMQQVDDNSYSASQKETDTPVSDVVEKPEYYRENQQIEKTKETVFIDPFCGSGSFLENTFYYLVDEKGYTPEEAYLHIIGFDVNPIAVFLARLTMLFAYYNKTQTFPPFNPLVYYSNSLELVAMQYKMQSGHDATSENITELLNLISPFNLNDIDFDLLHALPILEELFKNILNLAEEKLKQGWNITPALLDRLLEEELNYTYLDDSVLFSIRKLWEHIAKEELIKLLQKYGDGIWNVNITSLLAVRLFPLLLEKYDVYAISNPPWITIARLHNERYKDLLLEGITNLYRGMRNGLDTSVVYTTRWAMLPHIKGVSFIVNANGVYTLKPENNGQAIFLHKMLHEKSVPPIPYRVIYYNKPVFSEGQQTAIISTGNMSSFNGKTEEFIKKANISANSVALVYTPTTDSTGAFTKAEDLYNVVKRAEVYYQSEITLKGAIKVRGDVSWLSSLSPEEREGYIVPALIIEDVMYYAGKLKARLNGMSEYVVLPVTEDLPYAEIIRPSDVTPFYVRRTGQLFLTGTQGHSLLSYIDLILKASHELSEEGKKGLMALKDRIRDKALPVYSSKTLSEKPVVVFSSRRSWKSFVLSTDWEFLQDTITPERHIPVYLHAGFGVIEAESDEIAYYYSGILNFLIPLREHFVRNSRKRALLYIKALGLEWEEKSWQRRIAHLSRLIQSSTHPQVCSNSNARKSTECLFTQSSAYRQIFALVFSHLSDDAGLEVFIDRLNSM